MAVLIQFTPEYLVDGPTPPAPPTGPCEEIGRVSRAFVSAHNRTRIHGVKVREGEKRCLIANFNGAVPASRAIVKAVWRLQSTACVSMSGGQITDAGRSTEVLLAAHLGGVVAINCEATFDNGEVYVQVFVVQVARAAVSPASQLPTGAQEVTVVA